MKRQAYTLLAIASLLLAVSVTPAYAQSARRIMADIPFSFFVKDKALPAGEYTIEPIQIGASQALKIQSRDGLFYAVVSARPCSSRSIKAEAVVVFNRAGEQYFLSEVMGFEEKAAYRLPASRVEDAFAKGGNGAKRHRVSVAGARQ